MTLISGEGEPFHGLFKTGPKMVFLSPQVRAILDGLKTKRSTFIFPSPSGKPFTSLQDYWFKLRSAAKLDRLRLHDFRHHYASIAIRNSESISAIGRLQRLRPKTRDQVIWDAAVPHFGIRIRSNGTMSYVYISGVNGKAKKTTLGNAKLMPLG